MKIEMLTSNREKEYEDFLLSHEESLFNASLLSREFLKAMCPGAIPYYFIAIDDGRIVGALPSFLQKGKLGSVLNALPWYGSNPGVVADNHEAFYLLLQAFDNTAHWTDCFSSTFISPPNQNQDMYEYFFERKEVFCSDRIGLITELPRFETPEQFANDLLKRIHQKTRNQTLKSARLCVPYETYTPDDWVFLAETHKENMKAVGAVPKSREFQIIKENFKQKKDYALYVSLTNDDKAERTAALLVEYYNKTAEYITPAIKAEHRNLCSMNLLILAAMGDAAQKGYKYWNWGGTSLPSQEGVYHFKKRFGANESHYRYYTQIYKPLTFNPTKKWLTENYPYFFVLPYDLLDDEGDIDE